jgi:hypothetical protein
MEPTLLETPGDVPQRRVRIPARQIDLKGRSTMAMGTRYLIVDGTIRHDGPLEHRRLGQLFLLHSSLA